MNVACLTKTYVHPNETHDIRIHYMFQKFAGNAGQGNWAIIVKARDLSAFLNRGQMFVIT